MASDALVRHAAIVGSVGECRERVREILALGPEEVTFRLPAEGPYGHAKGVRGGGVGGVRWPLPPYLPLLRPFDGLRASGGFPHPTQAVGWEN